MKTPANEESVIHQPRGQEAFMSEEPPAPDSGYVFEMLEDKSLSIRRADMERPQARTALLTLLSVLYRVRLRDTDIEYCLARTPSDWAFLAVRARKSDGRVGLKARRAEREPGINSGDNSVIASVDVDRIHQPDHRARLAQGEGCRGLPAERWSAGVDPVSWRRFSLCPVTQYSFAPGRYYEYSAQYLSRVGEEV